MGSQVQRKINYNFVDTILSQLDLFIYGFLERSLYHIWLDYINFYPNYIIEPMREKILKSSLVIKASLRRTERTFIDF